MPRVLVLLSAVLFGTTGTAQALGPDAAPVTVGAARIAVGGVLLLLVARAVPPVAAPWPRRELRPIPGARPPGRAAARGRGGALAAPAVPAPVSRRAFSAAAAGPGAGGGGGAGWGGAPATAGLAGGLAEGEPLTARWAGATALACAGVLL